MKIFAFSVSKDVDNRTLLVDFIRRTACLPGTKWMCREGGCGACVVTQIVTDPITGKKKPRAINSVGIIHFQLNICGCLEYV